MQPTSNRNITRYTYVKAAFQGWRVCICRNRRQFVRYFSDKVFGGEERSLAAAQQLRDRILDELNAEPGNVDAIFARHR